MYLGCLVRVNLFISTLDYCRSGKFLLKQIRKRLQELNSNFNKIEDFLIQGVSKVKVNRSEGDPKTRKKYWYEYRSGNALFSSLFSNKSRDAKRTVPSRSAS